ncbi:5066_t:CDS:2, partial [Racocetra fulgida]
DLDKYVADLIMKEASAKNKLYNKEGIRAYLPHTETVDGHNQALIKKSEEDAAAARMRNFRRLERLHRRRSSKRRHRDSDRSSRRRSRRDKSRYADHFSSSRYSDSDYSEEEISRKESKCDVNEGDVKTPDVNNHYTDHVNNHYMDNVNNHDMDNCDMSNSDMSISPISMSPKINSYSASEVSKSAPVIIRKGRGEVSDGSKMDKYFEKDYDP